MTSPCKHAKRPPGRHDLVFVSPAGWRAILDTRGDLATDALVARWPKMRWPTIRRRALPGEANGLALGLPLPPSAGKKRISLLVDIDHVTSVARPPLLRQARAYAPRNWWSTLDRLDGLARRHAVDARVFGSLAWQSLTGLDYVTTGSDLDVLFEFRTGTDIDRFVADVAAIETDAPMRLDGELMGAGGAAVNWREFHGGATELLVKSIDSVGLLGRHQFISGAMAS
ncbi:malonate decarboxylase holo-[acyl-carrier-protein] synthase [Bradyrhizobium iriomotense]|uniref:malonate decarboxylase holo-[acyl-carrier-protein] synthase n=1 Tax=Bradyrhizobium iriomotense TaxID=441950 RepID=UPI001B8A8876|nr:malonate decarboxylase holo-[acyl-carrier-protein] synthase [Bradyrhizobium iriomotense]